MTAGPLSGSTGAVAVAAGLPGRPPAVPVVRVLGEDDEEIAFGGGAQLLASGLDRRRLKHASFPGHDHNGMLDHINEALPWPSRHDATRG